MTVDVGVGRRKWFNQTKPGTARLELETPYLKFETARMEFVSAGLEFRRPTHPAKDWAWS